MPYAKLRRLAQESTNFTVQVNTHTKKGKINTKIRRVFLKKQIVSLTGPFFSDLRLSVEI